MWMNERMARIGGGHCAEFVTAFNESSPSVGSPLDYAVWLVWKYEGDSTLYNMMEKVCKGGDGGRVLWSMGSESTNY